MPTPDMLGRTILVFLSVADDHPGEEMTEEEEALFRSHVQFVWKLQHEHPKCLGGGPVDFGDLEDAPVGMNMMLADSAEEAISICSQDPAVKAGWFTLKAVPWYFAKAAPVLRSPNP